MKTVIFLLNIFLVTTLNAKIIEVEQLFNKRTTKVKEESVRVVKSFYGNTQIDESKELDVSLRFNGFITVLNADKTYMRVAKGDKLFSIYSDQILSIHKELIVSKKINRKLYQSSLEKLIALDISRKELNRIKSINSIKSINVVSPIDGVVMKKNISKGSFAKKGKSLLKLVDIKNLWFNADVYQKDISYIKKGMQAKIYIDGVDRPIVSKVDYIYPIIDEKTKTFKVRFLLNNQDIKFFPNMFGKVKIASSQKRMLTLPKTAVLNKASKFYVFKPISKSQFEPVEVKVKRVSSNKYEILSGLEKGDIVINNALFLLDSDAITNALYDSEDDEEW